MIYIASPFFNAKEQKIYRKVINVVKSAFPAEEIFIPADHEIPNAWDMSNAEWGKKVFEIDLAVLDKADKVVVIDWGMYSDTGTAWECGYAYAKGKEVYVLPVGEQKVRSLMIANGCTEFCVYNDDEIEVK